jgi:hypothetical protein
MNIKLYLIIFSLLFGYMQVTIGFGLQIWFGKVFESSTSKELHPKETVCLKTPKKGPEKVSL